MELTDNNYLSIFDLELNKFIRENPNQEIVGVVSLKTLEILETSPNLLYIREPSNNIIRKWRNSIDIIIDEKLEYSEEDFYFITKKNYKEEKNGK